MAQRRAIILSRSSFWKRNFRATKKKIFRQSLYNLIKQVTEASMSTNNSRESVVCRRQVLSEEQREGERQRARVNRRRASEEDRERERVRGRRRRQNCSEEGRQVERVRARRRRENYSEEGRQAEWDRARMNRQRQREREIQRQRERQQSNDMMTEGENYFFSSKPVLSTFIQAARYFLTFVTLWRPFSRC